MAADSFAQHCREIARRFLLTAVLVDDELSVSADPPIHGELKEPEQVVPSRRAPTSEKLDLPPPRPINVDPITRSFAHQGMVCGVVSPREGQKDHEEIAKAVARADIVILDWQLSRTDPCERATAADEDPGRGSAASTSPDRILYRRARPSVDSRRNNRWPRRP